MLLGSIIGIGVLALGLIFGFVLLGPCGGNGCGFAGGVVDSTSSNLLSWGIIVLGIVILAASLLLGRRAVSSKSSPTS